MQKLYFVFLVLLALIVVGGCGSGHVPGGGTVTYATGEPVPMGIVSFSNHQYNYMGAIRDGVFTLGGLKEGDGLPPGSYQVHFLGTDPETDLPLFATKYQSPDSSGIVCEVESGKKNQFDFVVEKFEGTSSTGTGGPR
jgi:hypothetical protein